MRDPATYLKGDLIPTNDEGGRPRHRQNWEYILVNELVLHFQGARKAIRELADQRTQGLIQGLAEELLPPELWPPASPMRYHHFKYGKNTYLARPDIAAEYRRIHREAGCELAREVKNFPDGGPRATIHPTEAITTAADGKVVATRAKAKPGSYRKVKGRATGKTERKKKRFDPDKKLYHEGDSKEAWGLKFLPIHTSTPFGPVVLDIPLRRRGLPEGRGGRDGRCAEGIAPAPARSALPCPRWRSDRRAQPGPPH
jgi:hypothetical protein